jgi:xylan 1,4-beta-xylosidase
MQLTIDLNDAGTPLNPIWQFGGNTCHAPLLLRDDLQAQLSRVRQELGFRYIRCHGMLSDNMGVVREHGGYDFSKIDAALDALRVRGLKPFFELSCMPGSMATTEEYVCFYKFFSSPPKEWAQWYALIKALLTHLTERYGCAELRTWYFEVWNEPDIAFWSGTQREYFKLYDLAARAVKEVDVQYRIGGPATARTNWIDEFLAHVSTPSADFGLACSRCDFISTHAYPSDVEFLDAAHGEVALVNSNIMRELFGAVRRKVDAVFGPEFPIICGEWNSSAGPLVFNHDECNNAAYIVKTMVELAEVCQGSLYWNISDIYEECDFHFEPFHGGYGLLNVNDVRKSSFHAFALLHEHAGSRLAVQCSETHPGLGCLATRTQDTLRLLVYYYQEPDAPTPAPVTLTFAGLPAHTYQADVKQVLPGQGSAYESWVAAGKPMFANRALFERLEAASIPARSTLNIADGVLAIQPGTITQITIPLPG